MDVSMEIGSGSGFDWFWICFCFVFTRFLCIWAMKKGMKREEEASRVALVFREMGRVEGVGLYHTGDLVLGGEVLLVRSWSLLYLLWFRRH